MLKKRLLLFCLLVALVGSSVLAQSGASPTLAIDHKSVTVDEGQTASNSGAVSDPDGDTVTLTSSVGAVTLNPDGSWAWAFATADGPADSQRVSITATDSDGDSSSIAFDLTVNNVAPTSTFGSATSGETTSLSFTNSTDPAETDFLYSYDCQNDGTFELSESTSANFYCPSGSDVRGRIADKDGGFSDFTSAVISPLISTQLVVNEIDYDQDSTDTAEFVEIKNVSGGTINLGTYTVQFINGNAGGAAVYFTLLLPEIDLAAGDYFVICANTATVANCDLDLSPDTNFIQNGDPDAVAIFQGDVLIDSISYGGDTGGGFTEGSGVGLDDNPAIFQAGLSRFPDGVDTDVNNVDVSFRCITPGETNSANSADCDAPAGPVLVINEIDYDQDGTDATEFIEIKNNGAAINLDAFIVRFIDGETGSTYSTVDLPDFELAAGAYYVICSNANVTPNCDFDSPIDNDLIQDGEPDAIAIVEGSTIIDTVSYEGDTPGGYTEGFGVGLEDVPELNEIGISRFPDGVDTNVNNVDFSSRCITPGAPNTANNENCDTPSTPVLVINEIDYDQNGTDAAEFIEIKNNGAPVDLNPYSVQFINGNAGGAVVYATIDLPAVVLAAGDYFVICANAATVANCDLDSSPDTNFIQNGAPDAVALMLGTAIVDTLSYEGDTTGYTESSGVGLEDDGTGTEIGLSRFPDGLDTDVNNVDFSLRCITPGIPNTAEVSSCGAPPVAVRIREIQGAAQIPPLLGQGVTNVPGIVTGLKSNGFFLQDPAPDADDGTSEGIFVFTSSAPTVALGDSITVNGNVTEYFRLTQISAPTITVVSTGNALPAPIVLGIGGRVPPNTIIDDDGNTTYDPTTDGLDFWESLEGMRVQVNNGLVVAATNNFGEFVVVADNGVDASALTPRGGLAIQPTDFNPERIMVDDGALPSPALNTGARITSPIVGPLDFTFDNSKIVFTEVFTFDPGTLTPEIIPVAANADQISIASFNVENLDPSDPDAKFAQLAGIVVNNLKSPDILGLQEVQDNNGATNDGTVDASATYAELIAAIQTAGGPLYEYRDIAPSNGSDGGEPGGNIRVGFLYRLDRVFFVDRPGGTATNTTTPALGPSGVELDFSPGRIDPTNTAFADSRKPLVGEFIFNGHKVIVVVNHFNSKGGDDALFGAVQPPVLSSEVQRNQQAQVVNDFVDSVLALDPAANVVVFGDLNDFPFSNPLQIVAGGVLTNLTATLPLNEQYTYVFDGNSQALDNFLVSSNLASQVASFDIVHVNVEFTASTRATDHDPSMAIFNLPRPNNPPVAVDDEFTIDQDTSLNFSAAQLLANDTDADSDPLNIAGAITFDVGAVVDNGGGNYTFTPPAGFTGIATGTYTVSDGEDTDTGSIIVTVEPIIVPNNPPVAVDDPFTINQDTFLTFRAAEILANDTDADSDVLTITGAITFDVGAVVNNGDGTFTFTPPAGFTGIATGTYTVSDGEDTDTGSIIVTVEPVIVVNNPPVAVDDPFTIDQDTSLNFSIPQILANDTDADSDPLNLVGDITFDVGAIVNNGSGNYTFTPPAGFTGIATGTYTVSDGTDTDIGAIIVTVEPVVIGNNAPVAVDDPFTIDQDTSLNFSAAQILSNDTDADSDPLSITGDITFDIGAVVNNGDGTYTFTPPAGFTGIATGTYTVSDGQATDTGSIIVTVEPVVIGNQPPVAVDDLFTIGQDTSLTLTLAMILGNDSDPDGDTITPTSGVVFDVGSTVNNGDGSGTFTPPSGFVGIATATYTISDGNGGTDSAQIIVTVIGNNPPVAEDDAFSINQDTSLALTLPMILGNDSDPDGDTITPISAVVFDVGSSVNNGDGSGTFTPPSGFVGIATATYTISDGRGGTDSATVTVEVKAVVNNPPDAVDDLFTIDQDTSLDLTLATILGNDSDPDGDTITPISAVVFDVGSVAYNSDGSGTYTPPPGFVGIATATYTISDGRGGSDSAQVIITVTAGGTTSQ